MNRPGLPSARRRPYLDQVARRIKANANLRLVILGREVIHDAFPGRAVLLGDNRRGQHGGYQGEADHFLSPSKDSPPMDAMTIQPCHSSMGGGSAAMDHGLGKAQAAHQKIE